jgi:uncharacterized repeat protein (TIGR03803 family)
MTRSSCWKTISLVCVLIAVTAMSSHGQTFTTLLTFNGPDGSYPGGFLVQGTDGDLYGTTVGSDTIFKITPGGILTTLYTFSGPDGRDPIGLTLGTDENFYGTASEGGSYTACPAGCGTVFKITAAGALTTLHSFDSTDGSFPAGVVVQGTDGNFYGTTEYGGANSCIGYGSGCGTIFKISSTGTFTTLHSFNGTDGSSPVAGLVEGIDGNFYGTTLSGGANGFGTVFKITPAGVLTTLHSFCAETGCTDGQSPFAGLIQATDGNFYGTTTSGGNMYCYYGAQGGTIFKVTPGGRLTTLHSFCYSEGRGPESPLTQATDGKLYGTARSGGNGGNGNCTAVFDPGCGTMFKIPMGGVLTNAVHTFDFTDGDLPVAGLVQATSGTLYGTTVYGGKGTYAFGTVFSQTLPGVQPFVTTLPTSRKVGQHVAILGTDLTGATSVTFNGTPATFTVVSSTEISTTVPIGSTTGTVKVVTSSGTLSSNVPFRVTK